MAEAIATRWRPINSKEALQFYLKADTLALGIDQQAMTRTRKITHSLGLTHHIWRYLRLLREAEYLHNCKKARASKPREAYNAYKLYRLGLHVQFHLPLNVFGPGFSIIHYGPIIVHRNARIGANCNFVNCVHIGQKTARDNACPTIGDNVVIAPGVRILGGIVIADGTLIGANSVVTKSVLEPYTTIAGAPARKIKDGGIESYWRPGAKDALLSYISTNRERFSEQ